MRDDAILATLEELDRWKRRRAELSADAPPAEIEKVARQITYYEALVAEMKRAMRPTGLRDLLRTM